MSNYARLDENNVVINVECAEPEWVAEQPDPSIFVAYTDENPAGIGYTYSAVDDVFIAPQPYPSWSLDDDFEWQPPTPKPEGDWVWNEAEGEWESVVEDDPIS